jgi:hypothetical protein
MNKTKKLIAFPDNLVQLVEIKADTFGFTFGEYVRYVLANDVKSITETVEIMDKAMEKDLSEALIDVENNNITKVSREGITKHLQKISNVS